VLPIGYSDSLPRDGNPVVGSEIKVAFVRDREKRRILRMG
jgi:hypothetical protein